MLADHIFQFRETACVIVRLVDADRAEWARLGPCFVTGAGTRGALLKRRARRAGQTSMHVFPRLRTAYGAVTLAGYRALCEDPLVKDVSLSGSVDLLRPILAHSVEFSPVKPSPGPTRGLEILGIPELWAFQLSGAGVRIGHIDNGVDRSHPALRDAVEQAVAIDGAGRAHDLPENVPDAVHGTHTAATIAGRVHDGLRIGAAPGALLQCAAVVGGGDAVVRFLGGIEWSLRRKVKVINLSLGERGYVDSFRNIIADIRQHGCLPVCAAGNHYEGSTLSPANYENALSVGALDSDQLVAEFSSSERMQRAHDPIVPDLVAPGVAVASAVPGQAYAAASGTSMASPHIAGLAALLFEAYPHSTVDQVEQAIFVSCNRRKGQPEARAGRGVPNGPAALEALASLQ